MVDSPIFFFFPLIAEYLNINVGMFVFEECIQKEAMVPSFW